MIKEKITHIALASFKVLTWLVQAALVIGIIQNLYWLVRTVSSSDNSMYSKFFVLYFKTISPNLVGQQVLSCLTVIFHLIIISMFLIMMTVIRKIITSIQQGLYFTTNNLTYIRRLFLTSSTALIIQLIQLIGLYPLVAANNGYSSSIRRNDNTGMWLIELLFVVIIYVVYQVFHSGIKLKEENNEFI